MPDDIVRAPFTPEQCLALNLYQRSGYFHEFTCGRYDVLRKQHGRNALPTEHWECPGRKFYANILVALPQGWVCPACGYTQNWAHAWMADHSWRKAQEQQLSALFNRHKPAGATE